MRYISKHRSIHKLILRSGTLIFCAFLLLKGETRLYAQELAAKFDEEIAQAEGKEKVDLLNEFSIKLKNTQPVQARDYAQQALDLARTISYPSGAALALKNLGNIYLLQSNNAYALEFFLEALQTYERLGQETRIAETLNNIGIVYQKLRKYSRAEAYYARVLEIDEKKKDLKGQASTLNNIGDIYYQQNKFEEALENYNRALKIQEEIGDKTGVAISLQNIGLVEYTQTNYASALSNYKRAIEINREMGNRANYTSVLNKISNVFLKLELPDSAAHYAEECLDLAIELNLSQEEADASNTLADIYFTQNRFELAYEYLLEHVVIEEELFDEANEKKVIDLQNSYELEKKQQELDNLNKNREIRNLRNNLLISTLSLGLLLVSIIVYILYRSNQQKRKSNVLLQQQNEEIILQSNALESQRNQIEKQRDEIAAKNQNIRSSILYAKRIQDAMLPYEEEIDKKLPLHFIFYLPRDVVSGDFYWYNHVDSKPIYSNIYPEKTDQKILVDFQNEKSIIAAVDCTGHGIPGAFMSMIGDSLLNQIVLDKGITQPDQILTEMHKGIRKALHQAESHNPDGMDMSICVIDKESKVIEFAGARNPLLYFQNGEMHYIKGDSFSVGGWLTERENKRVFSSHKISYADAPITFYIYSDGYRDQFGGPQNTKFLRRRFRELLQEIHNEPMTYQRGMLSRSLREWMGDYRQMDDILVIGVRLD